MSVGLPQVPVQIKKRFLQDLNFEVACELGASKIMGRNIYRRLNIQPADFGLLDLQVLASELIFVEDIKGVYVNSTHSLDVLKGNIRR